MKSFKEFASRLIETTVPENLHPKVGTWQHHSEVNPETRQKIEQAVGPKGHTMFPLNIASQVETDPDVHEHLTAHGYRVKDYIKGIASTTKRVGNPEVGFRDKEVEERIGSVLDKTNAPAHVKSSFMNDPYRQATKAANHHVLITTTPLGVAGMTTGTAWKNQSCMNMEGGGYAHKLEDDSKHGTHVAYLVSPEDQGAKHGEPDNPLARMVLKPYHEGRAHEGEKFLTPDTAKDTIFRPESKVYGAESSHFKNAVHDWAEKNYPAAQGKTYIKNFDVYDDTGNTEVQHVSKADIEHEINTTSGISNLKSFSPDIVSHAIKYGTEKLKHEPVRVYSSFLRSLGAVNNLSTGNVMDIHKASKTISDQGLGYDVRQRLAARHGDKFSTNMINEFVGEHGHDYLPTRVLMSSKLPDEVVDKLPITSYNMLKHGKLKQKHYDKVADAIISNESDASPGNIGQYFDKISKEKVGEIVNKNPRKAFRFINSITSHSGFDQQMHDRMVKAVKNNEVEQGSLGELVAMSKFAKVSDATANNIHVSPESFAANKHLAESEEPKVKDMFVKSHKMFMTIPGNISRHMTDEDYKTIAKDTSKDVTFKDMHHSNRFLDTIKSNIHEANNGLTDAVKSGADENTLAQKRGALNHHIGAYANNIEEHITQHIAGYDDEGDYVSKDPDELDKTKNRVEEVKTLSNYDVSHPMHRDHFIRTFRHVIGRMIQLS